MAMTDISRQGRIPASDLYDRGAPLARLADRCVALGGASGAVQKAMSDAERQIASGLKLCESPIEAELLPWLVCEDYNPLMTCPARVHLFGYGELMPPEGDIIIVPQFPILRYRLDFALIATCAKGTKIVAVECDGKEFHKDRDKDIRRNSYLRKFGIQTVRATGAEIMREPHNVSRRAASLISEWAAP